MILIDQRKMLNKRLTKNLMMVIMLFVLIMKQMYMWN